jgi:hypothetical protein
MPQDGPVRQGAAVRWGGFLGARAGGGLMQAGLLPMVRRIFWQVGGVAQGGLPPVLPAPPATRPWIAA